MRDEKPNQQSSVFPAYLSRIGEDDTSKTRQFSFALYVLVMVGMLIFNVVAHFVFNRLQPAYALLRVGGEKCG